MTRFRFEFEMQMANPRERRTGCEQSARVRRSNGNDFHIGFFFQYRRIETHRHTGDTTHHRSPSSVGVYSGMFRWKPRRSKKNGRSFLTI